MISKNPRYSCQFSKHPVNRFLESSILNSRSYSWSWECLIEELFALRLLLNVGLVSTALWSLTPTVSMYLAASLSLFIQVFMILLRMASCLPKWYLSLDSMPFEARLKDFFFFVIWLIYFLTLSNFYLSWGFVGWAYSNMLWYIYDSLEINLLY